VIHHQETIRVPIGVSEVAYHLDAQRVVLAVVPCQLDLPNSPGVMRFVSTERSRQAWRAIPPVVSPEMRGADRGMWFFVLPLDELHGSEALWVLLHQLGSLGAIRTDLEDSYNLSLECAGTGVSASVHKAKSLRRCGSLPGDAAIKIFVKAEKAQVEDILVHELQMLARAQGHSHVCKLYGTFMRVRSKCKDESDEGDGDLPAFGGYELCWAMALECC